MRLNLGEVKLKKMLSSGLRLLWEGGGVVPRPVFFYSALFGAKPLL